MQPFHRMRTHPGGRRRADHGVGRSSPTPASAARAAPYATAATASISMRAPGTTSADTPIMVLAGGWRMSM